MARRISRGISALDDLVSAQEPRWLWAGRIPSLDGVRALAALLVIYAHATIPFVQDGLPGMVKIRCGFLGVQIFFVLSGFLITNLMLREIERTGALRLRGFYFRRFLRIIPAYAALLLVVGVLQTAGDAHLSGRDWLAALTYTVNFQMSALPPETFHAWSLSVEEHFYLIWPFVMATLTLASSRRVAVTCIGTCLAFRWAVLILFPHAPARVTDLWSIARMDDIAVGCLLAFLVTDDDWRRRLDGIVSRSGMLGLILVVLALTQALGTRYLGTRLLGPMAFHLVAGLSNTVTSIGIVVLLWAAIRRADGFVGRLLNSKPMREIGLISYSLYLWHVLFNRHDIALFDVFPLNIAFMFAAAFASHCLIERPFLALKDRLAVAEVPRDAKLPRALIGLVRQPNQPPTVMPPERPPAMPSKSAGGLMPEAVGEITR